MTQRYPGERRQPHTVPVGQDGQVPGGGGGDHPDAVRVEGTELRCRVEELPLQGVECADREGCRLDHSVEQMLRAPERVGRAGVATCHHRWQGAC